MLSFWKGTFFPFTMESISFSVCCFALHSLSYSQTEYLGAIFDARPLVGRSGRSFVIKHCLYCCSETVTPILNNIVQDLYAPGFVVHTVVTPLMFRWLTIYDHLIVFILQVSVLFLSIYCSDFNHKYQALLCILLSCFTLMIFTAFWPFDCFGTHQTISCQLFFRF